MEFIYCNNCFVKRVENQSLLFHMTECGHIFCDACINAAGQKCFRCTTANTKSVRIQEPLMQQIAHLFTSTSDLLEKALQAESFQEFQRTISFQYGIEVKKKYESLKQVYRTNHENSKVLCVKYKKVKSIIMAIEERIKKLSEKIEADKARSNQSTPVFKVPIGSARLSNSRRTHTPTNQSSPIFTVTMNNSRSMHTPLSRSSSDFKVPMSDSRHIYTPIYRTPSPSDTDISMRKLCLNTPSMNQRPSFNNSYSSISCNSLQLHTPSQYGTPCSQIRTSNHPIQCPRISRSRQSQDSKRNEDAFRTPPTNFNAGSSSTSSNSTTRQKTKVPINNFSAPYNFVRSNY